LYINNLAYLLKSNNKGNNRLVTKVKRGIVKKKRKQKQKLKNKLGKRHTLAAAVEVNMLNLTSIQSRV